MASNPTIVRELLKRVNDLRNVFQVVQMKRLCGSLEESTHTIAPIQTVKSLILAATQQRMKSVMAAVE